VQRSAAQRSLCCCMLGIAEKARPACASYDATSPASRERGGGRYTACTASNNPRMVRRPFAYLRQNRSGISLRVLVRRRLPLIRRDREIDLEAAAAGRRPRGRTAPPFQPASRSQLHYHADPERTEEPLPIYIYHTRALWRSLAEPDGVCTVTRLLTRRDFKRCK
jgi:hypothetical protein